MEDSGTKTGSTHDCGLSYPTGYNSIEFGCVFRHILIPLGKNYSKLKLI